MQYFVAITVDFSELSVQIPCRSQMDGERKIEQIHLAAIPLKLWGANSPTVVDCRLKLLHFISGLRQYLLDLK